MQLICGMHRSGTSLVAQIAHNAGADFGDPENFWPADAWNPQGYFEHRDIIAVNRRLINGRIGKLHYLFPPSQSLISKRAERYKTELKLLASKYADNVVKENRLCLTLQEWLVAGADVSRILVVIRDPIGVASSLRRRNHIPAIVSDRLWHDHLARLENTIGDIPTQYLWYDEFVSGLTGTRSGLKKLAWLTGLETSTLQKAARGIILHSNAVPQPPSKKMPAGLLNLYTKLIQKSQLNVPVSHD